ncbi:F-box protein-like protein isoform X2 [Tanacetum coccineum]
MDSGKKSSKFLGFKNNKIYMDLKLILREHALQFLPAKSLVRFQGVCRDWRLMISTPFFAHNQSLSFRSVAGLFFSGNPSTFISIDPQSCGVPDPALNFLPAPVDILASSNGLLLCKAQAGDQAYYVCNPVTMQWKKLPKPNMEHGNEPAVVLNFKPSLLNFVAEFTVVCAVRSNDFDDATEFEIYNSKDGTWKMAKEINFSVRKVIPKSGVCVNDIVYWQTYGGILSFDMVKDRSQIMHGHGHNGILGEYNGKLCSASITGRTLKLHEMSNIYSNTMQMGSNSHLWDNGLIIHVPSEVYAHGDASYSRSILYVGSDIVVLRGGRKVYRYDIKTKETKFVVEAPENNQLAIPYVNSLVSL